LGAAGAGSRRRAINKFMQDGILFWLELTRRELGLRVWG
jgi:hypothetical protein